MNDHEAPEAVQARKDQPDPLVMYLVVRESLGMGPGKIGAQCAHAAQMALIHFMHWKENHRRDPESYHSKSEYKRISTMTHLEDGEAAMMQLWLESSYRKVVLRADDKEWEKLKAAGLRIFTVKDAGLTEVVAGSETVICVWPMHKSAAPKTIRKLQAL